MAYNQLIHMGNIISNIDTKKGTFQTEYGKKLGKMIAEEKFLDGNALV